MSPAVDVATGVSKLTFPQDLQSAFFRCVATNPMGSDDYVMRFLGGRLIYFLHLNILDWLALEYSPLSSLLAGNVRSGDEHSEQLYSLQWLLLTGLSLNMFVCVILSTLYLVNCCYFLLLLLLLVVLVTGWCYPFPSLSFDSLKAR